LSQRENDWDLFFSRDAGKSFHKLHEGAHYTLILNHGGILVLGSQNDSTIHWSTDEGRSWSKCLLSANNATRISRITDNMFESTSLPFPFCSIPDLLGSLGHPSFFALILDDRVYKMGYVDFSQLHQSVCQGEATPGTEASDFELWTPSTPKGEHCILGSTITYIRKKAERNCFIAPETNRIHSEVICPCSLRDYEWYEFAIDCNERSSNQPL